MNPVSRVRDILIVDRRCIPAGCVAPPRRTAGTPASSRLAIRAHRRPLLSSYLGLGTLVFCCSAALADEPTTAAERRETFESITQELNAGAPIELKALEIRAKIYEPSVIYILDRTRLEIDYREKETGFSSRIQEPIVENLF